MPLRPGLVKVTPRRYEVVRVFTSIFRVLFLCAFLLLSAAIDQMGIGEATPALQGLLPPDVLSSP